MCLKSLEAIVETSWLFKHNTKRGILTCHNLKQIKIFYPRRFEQRPFVWRVSRKRNRINKLVAYMACYIECINMYVNIYLNSNILFKLWVLFNTMLIKVWWYSSDQLSPKLVFIHNYQNFTRSIAPTHLMGSDFFFLRSS